MSNELKKVKKCDCVSNILSCEKEINKETNKFEEKFNVISKRRYVIDEFRSKLERVKRSFNDSYNEAMDIFDCFGLKFNEETFKTFEDETVKLERELISEVTKEYVGKSFVKPELYGLHTEYALYKVVGIEVDMKNSRYANEFIGLVCSVVIVGRNSEDARIDVITPNTYNSKFPISHFTNNKYAEIPNKVFDKYYELFRSNVVDVLGAISQDIMDSGISLADFRTGGEPEVFEDCCPCESEG